MQLRPVRAWGLNPDSGVGIDWYRSVWEGGRAYVRGTRD